MKGEKRSRDEALEHITFRGWREVNSPARDRKGLTQGVQRYKKARATGRIQGLR